MFERVTVRATDLAASTRFYETTLEAAGIHAWPDFRVEPATDEQPVTRRMHIGFAVTSRDLVHAFWNAGVAAGYTDDGLPGPRPQYTEDYYGGFLLDPDANSAEAVHRADGRTDGIVDHVWIRVADLAASRDHYERIATESAFRVNKELPGRVAFVREGDGGGDFSIVEGDPTEGVDLVFQG